jgi:hypothetical protein
MIFLTLDAMSDIALNIWLQAAKIEVLSN